MSSPPVSRWSHATSLLWFSALLYSFGDIFFGYDAALFGSLQALPSWLNRFGDDIDGVKGLSTQTTSIANSVVWAGKGMGTILVEPLIERLGYKKMMFLICIIQFVGVTVEMTAGNWGTFAAGRTVTYFAAGLVENVVPSYTAEVSPAPLRGFFTGSLVTFLVIGNLLGTALCRAYATVTTDLGWRIPVAIGYLPAVVVITGLFFTPESPRWLISKGFKDEALVALGRLRPARQADDGTIAAEINALEEAVIESKSIQSGRWVDLFSKRYVRRSMISMWLFIFGQISGAQFVGSYGPTFYKQMGLGGLAFTFQILPYAISIVAASAAQFFYDRIGRRPILICSTAIQTLFMLLVAGLGSKANKTSSDVNGVVASLILFYPVSRIGLGNCGYLITSEMGGVDMRKKMMAYGTLWDVLGAFTVTYASPYLINAPSFLGAKVGWIFAAISAAAFFFVALFVPELSRRSLEETDQLFEKKLWAWQFSSATTTGIGAYITNLENSGDHRDSDKTVETMTMSPTLKAHFV